jgi:hypothetical protein
MSQITTRITGSGPGAVVETLTGNSGGPVGPIGGNINVLGTGVITVVGNPGTSTLTITPSGSIASSFITNPATGTATPVAGVLTFAGTGGITVSAAGSTVTIDGATISAGTITGNTGGPQPQTLGNWNILTANSTVQFAGAASTLTLDFGLRNLFLGTNPTLGGADENVAIGFNAGISVTSAIANVIIGFDAGASLTNGVDNVIIGDGAMSASGASTDENVAIGANSLQNLSGSSGNSALGFQSLVSLVNGSNNCALGIDAGSNYNGSESDNIVILNNGQNGENGVTRIGTNGNQLACFIAGIDGVNVGSVATIVTEASDQLGTAVLTAGTGVTITPGPNTITISAASAVSESFPTDSGTATPSAGVLNIFGDTHNIRTTGSGDTVTVGLTGITQHSLQVGGAAEALTQLGVATNGQLPIGSTGADPVLATITAGTGISISNGAGSITVSATGTTTLTVTSVNHAASPYTVLSADEFLAVDVTGGVVSILLPNAPVTGRVYYVKDSKGLAATSNITVTTVGGAVNIDGGTSFVMNTAYESISVIFDGTAYEVF